jgi:hypothetical protein
MAEFVFTVRVQTERESGKFASKDDLREEIRTWLEGANEDEISGVGSDGDSVYNVTEWEVEDAN